MSIEKVQATLIEDRTLHNAHNHLTNNNERIGSSQSIARDIISKHFLKENVADSPFHSAIVDCVSLRKLRETVRARKNRQNLSHIEKNVDEISSRFWGVFFLDLLTDLDAFLEKERTLQPLKKLIEESCLLYRLIILQCAKQQLNKKKDPKVNTRAELDTFVKSLKEILLDKLEKLAISESALFLFYEKNHAICLEIYRNESNYDIVVYNTGTGLLSFHSEATKKGSSHGGYYYPVLYRGIRKDQLPELARNLLLLQMEEDTSASLASSHKKPLNQLEELYKFLQSISSQVCKEPPKDHPLLAYKKQSFGTCQFSCIRAWLRQAISRQKDGARIYRKYNAFRLDKILQRISSATASKNGTELLSNETKVVISEIATASLKKRHFKIHNPSWPQYTKRLGFFQRILAVITRIFLFLKNQSSLLISRITGKHAPTLSPSHIERDDRKVGFEKPQAVTN